MSVEINCGDRCGEKKYMKNGLVLYTDPKITTEFLKINDRGESVYKSKTTPHLCIGRITKVPAQSLLPAFLRGPERYNAWKFKNVTVTEIVCRQIAEIQDAKDDRSSYPDIVYTLSPDHAKLVAAGQAETALDSIIDEMHASRKGGKRRTRRARSKRATRKYKR
jgi:hypothetical protein